MKDTEQTIKINDNYLVEACFSIFRGILSVKSKNSKYCSFLFALQKKFKCGHISDFQHWIYSLEIKIRFFLKFLWHLPMLEMKIYITRHLINCIWVFLMPALQQRFAKWHLQPMSNTWYCDSSTLDSTECFLPFIAEQLSEQKPKTICHGMLLNLKK